MEFKVCSQRISIISKQTQFTVKTTFFRKTVPDNECENQSAESPVLIQKRPLSKKYGNFV